MATLSITIPDAQVDRVNAAFADQFSYNAATDGTPSQFTKAQVIKFMKNVLKASEGRTAKNTAESTVESGVGLT